MTPSPESSTPAPESLRPAEANAGPAEGAQGEFLVVGIAASAGGLEAISDVLKRLPPSLPLAIVIVQHLDPNHESLLVELLNRVSQIPVQWAVHGRSIEPGKVYVSPAHACLEINQGVLLVVETAAKKATGECDHFLQSLANDMTHRAIAVVLSGNGSDGALGAKAIKDAGGIVFAQDPQHAAFPSMPQSAIRTGSVDRTMATDAIAEELTKLAQSSAVLWKRIAASEDAAAPGSEAELIATLFRMVASRTGVDFSEYKQSTIKRRIARQMMLSKVTDLAGYVKLLPKNRDELLRLYESLLINVTEFFRDPEYFDFLRSTILPELLTRRRDGGPIRFWVPGCSTGEEAFSLGILMRELMEERGEIVPVQIFGTDVSERVITHARAAAYSASDVAHISPERMKAYFNHTERGYVIDKTIRDMCIFARQNVAKDSPFSRIDLISCRNLLIYLSPKLQRKVMPIFHYALNPDGYLVLGTSESVGSQVELFRLIDRRFRIYSRKATNRRANFEIPVDHLSQGVNAPLRPLVSMSDDAKEPFDIIREADRIVLHRHGPVGALVNDDLEILQFRGDVSPYLAPVAGRASLHLMRMAKEGLGSALQEALHEAREKRERVSRPGITMLEGNVPKRVDIDITPIEGVHSNERFYLVLFAPAAVTESRSDAAGSKSKSKSGAGQTELDRVRHELQTTRNYLQTTIEKHEATNQELRAANEEIQSSNEELQSTNEELETAKEELQSTNEELTTVNEELHSRQLELIQLNNDLNNLINSVHLPIIILGQDMRIRRFTPMAEKVLKVIPTDIGRPLTDINTNLNVANLPRLIAEVVDTFTIKEVEVQDSQGRWYSLRLRPYKTAENKIDGVVLTLIDIDEMKRTISQLEETRDFTQAIIESVPAPLAVLTSDFRIKSANEDLAQLFRTSREKLVDRMMFEGMREHDELREKLAAVLANGPRVTNYESHLDLPGTGRTAVVLSGRVVASSTRSYPLILLTIRPIS